MLGNVQKTDLDKLAKLLCSENNGKIKYLPFLVFLRTLTSSIHEKSGENNEWDLKTACQQSCPTNAIVFGNVNDKNSAISKSRIDNFNRTFYSIEFVHTLPNVNYLAKVRNTDEA